MHRWRRSPNDIVSFVLASRANAANSLKMRTLPISPLLLPALLLSTACIPVQQREAIAGTVPPAVLPPQAKPLKNDPLSGRSPPAPDVSEIPPPPPLKRPLVQPKPQPPAWQVRKVEPSAVDVPASIYVVKPGDSLRRVTELTGAGSEAIARANAIEPPFRIVVGQKLKIPAGRYHRVGKGETGIAISRAYGVEWQHIAALNQLIEPYILREGQRLLVPSKVEVSKMTSDQRAAAFRLDIEDLITGSEPALASNAPAKPTVTPVVTPTRQLPPTVPVIEPSIFAGRFDWPVRGPILRSFGKYSEGQQNNGINIGTPRGSPVVATADGVVAYVGSDIPAFGTLILLRHGDGWISAYGYADSLAVTRGQKVKRGQTIARSGASPYTGEPQLHFEIRNGRKPVNPMSYLPGKS
jgi:murein DD-endopeptidase MepM/ murein hydrolase activator NlpD